MIYIRFLFIPIFFFITACTSTQQLLNSNTALIKFIPDEICYRNIEKINGEDAKSYWKLGGYMVPSGQVNILLKYKRHPIHNYKGCLTEFPLYFKADAGESYIISKKNHITSVVNKKNLNKPLGRFSVNLNGKVKTLEERNPLSNYTSENPYIKTTKDNNDFGVQPDSVTDGVKLLAVAFIPFVPQTFSTKIILINGDKPIIIKGENITKTILSKGVNTLLIYRFRSYQLPLLAFLQFDAKPRHNYRLMYVGEDKSVKNKKLTLLKLLEEDAEGKQTEINFKCHVTDGNKNTHPDTCINTSKRKNTTNMD